MDAKRRDRLTCLYSGVVYDALFFDVKYDRPFVLDAAIKPLGTAGSSGRLVGRALTCSGRRVDRPQHIDDTVRLKMFAAFFDGCVQVIDTDQDSLVAHFGDISGRLARQFGAEGAVIDGFTRDAALLEEIEFPVYCRGTQPIDAFGKWQIVEYGTEISMSGITGTVTVKTGDLVFGDRDGVLIIPEDLVDEMLDFAEKRLEREDMIRSRVKSMNDAEDLMDMYESEGRW